jgi:metallo-beta-lactamase class B
MNRLFFLILLMLPGRVPAQLTLQVTAIPANTPTGSTIYVAGNFNSWDPGHTDYQLSETEGLFSITLELAAGQYEYKFTRGSWATVEGNAQGAYLPNRVVQYNGLPDTLNLTIASWEDVSAGTSTAAENVTILTEDFFMPQLNRYRRIWLYLPPDYHATERSYPVLYMHDGQNLFDAATSFAGEWEVDETLNALFQEGDPGIIVVGIDNGGANRIPEYTPWPNPTYGGGEGDAYIDFLIETLKPYIDAHYRTLTGPEYTGIMGSSLGGLISLYGALREPEVFGKAGVFSPSLWFTNDIFTYAQSADLSGSGLRIYQLAGELEGQGSVADDIAEMATQLLGAGLPATELISVTHPDGQHSEWYWAREFGAAYTWLFANLTSTTPDITTGDLWQLAPNPATDTLRLLGEDFGQPIPYQVIDAGGKVWQSGRLQSPTLFVNQLPAGWYRLITQGPGESLRTGTFIIHRP